MNNFPQSGQGQGVGEERARGNAGGEAGREAGSGGGAQWAWARLSARQAAGCALAKPMAAHGHVNGWREGTA